MKNPDYNWQPILTSGNSRRRSSGNYGPKSYTYDGTTGNLASKAGVSYTYGDAAHKHAVTALSNGNTYSYDANGNMTLRVVGGQTYNLAYDAENRLVAVSGAANASFTYNGDGERVKAIVNGVTIVYVGEHYEWRGNTTDSIKYYFAGNKRFAMRVGTQSVKYLLGDHLGSTSVVLAGNGSVKGSQGYLPWGETRFGSVPTEYQFTGQYYDNYIKLMWYGSRWYDPALARWTQSSRRRARGCRRGIDMHTRITHQSSILTLLGICLLNVKMEGVLLPWLK